ncbi:MAG: uracil-DNA glycosylase [Clostridiales bacterium]|nr:uracil-DNA glycosylase [Clostridiales bacterium]
MAVLRFEWDSLYNELKDCTKCRLCERRTNIVIADGDPHASIMFIGEGPGREEDESGVPFVGAAGRLFNELLEEAGLDRRKVYICNIVKCRPPQNRDPYPDEAEACLPYLRAQVALVRPKVIVCLGRIAAKYVYDRDIQISKQRGAVKKAGAFYIIPTYHPAALLRKEELTNDLVFDLCTAKKLADRIEKGEEIEL